MNCLKKKFKNEARAKRHMEWLNELAKKTGRVQPTKEVYKCYCDYYHLTTRKFK